MGSVMEILNSGNVHKVRMAEYNAANTIRQASNKKEAAFATLAEFSRTLGNNLKVEAAGKQYSEAISGIAGQLEARTTGRVNASLSAAERLGQLSAEAGALGVGGSTVEMLNTTIKLQRNIEQDLQRIETERIAKAGGRAAGDIMETAFNSQDLSQKFGSFDFTINVVPKPLKYKWLKIIGVAAATYFGGPQAGEAAADAAVGEWKANNGDWDAAAQYTGRAVSGALGAIGSLAQNSGGGGEGMGGWFNNVMRRQDAQAASGQEQAINWGAFTPEDDANGSFSFGSGFGSGWGGGG